MKTIILGLSFLSFVFFSLSIKAQSISQPKTTAITDSVEYTLNGTIASKSGNTVNIKINNQRTIPTKGQTGILQKYFEEEIFGMKTTGWLDIGKMQITSIKPEVVIMQIIEEHSTVTKDGKKIDNYQAGKIVNFNWKTVK